MVIIYGSKMYGRIQRCGTTYMGTLFAHIYWMPLFPLGSKLVLQENGDGTYRFIPAGLDWRSTLAAYLRSWGVIGAMFALWFGIDEMQRADVDTVDSLLTLAASLFLVACAVGAWVWLGRLSSDEKGHRLAYQDFAGHPIDVAMMREAREPLRHRLYAHVVERARGLVSGGYRTTVDPATQWGAIALDPSVTDVAFLRAALTLTRLEWSFAASESKAQFASAHAMIWQKLKTAAPMLMEQANAA
jgi:hypothetical protein